VDERAQLRVRVDAVESEGFLNDLKPTVQLIDAASGERQAHAIPQTGPGEYELTLAPPQQPSLATIAVDNRVVARTALAGHYPREFYPLGNDRAAMRKLADMTGGDVIEPSDNRPIDFNWPTRTITLAPWLAAVGSLAISGALVVWRRR